jgi:hypothetical protein
MIGRSGSPDATVSGTTTAGPGSVLRLAALGRRLATVGSNSTDEGVQTGS